MFANRKDAGQRLGKALEKYKSLHPIVLGIPRGGIEVGYYVAMHLNCEFEPIIVRKLGYPQQPEAAFGALAEDGSLYLDPWSNQFLTKEIIEKVMKSEQEEIRRRIDTYRNGRNLSSLENRIVILTDDGIASGATLFAAMKMCQKQQPKKLIVAAPVSGTSKLQKINENADDVIILEKREEFFAVSEGYQDFSNLADSDVLHFLDLWQQKQKKIPPNTN